MSTGGACEPCAEVVGARAASRGMIGVREWRYIVGLFVDMMSSSTRWLEDDGGLYELMAELMIMSEQGRFA